MSYFCKKLLWFDQKYPNQHFEKFGQVQKRFHEKNIKSTKFVADK